MTLRELFTGWGTSWDEFYSTITTSNPIDWPMSYFFYIAGGAFGAFVALALVAGVISLIFER